LLVEANPVFAVKLQQALGAGAQLPAAPLASFYDAVARISKAAVSRVTTFPVTRKFPATNAKESLARACPPRSQAAASRTAPKARKESGAARSWRHNRIAAHERDGRSLPHRKCRPPRRLTVRRNAPRPLRDRVSVAVHDERCFESRRSRRAPDRSDADVVGASSEVDARNVMEPSVGLCC